MVHDYVYPSLLCPQTTTCPPERRQQKTWNQRKSSNFRDQLERSATKYECLRQYPNRILGRRLRAWYGHSRER